MRYKIGLGSKIGKFVIIGEGDDIPNTTIGDNAYIRSHTVIYGGNKIGNNFVTGHFVLIREFNRLGNEVSIGSNSILEHHITIGDRVRLHSGVFIPEFTIIEDDVWIGPCAVFTNAKYPNNSLTKFKLKGPIVGKNAKIGAGVVILPGVRIGSNALIGAGAVVTKDVKPNEVVIGNPARVLKNISAIKDYG